MKKIYGNSIIGVWYQDDIIIYPNKLDETKGIEWKASNPSFPNNLYPHLNNKPLEYDEEV